MLQQRIRANLYVFQLVAIRQELRLPEAYESRLELRLSQPRLFNTTGSGGCTQPL
jgi:hypothetical protein